MRLVQILHVGEGHAPVAKQQPCLQVFRSNIVTTKDPSQNLVAATWQFGPHVILLKDLAAQ
eukprot:92157-Amphidinium_carterae.2